MGRIVAALVASLFLAGCSTSSDKLTNEQIAVTVTDSMQKTFDTDSQFLPLHLHVTHVEVLNASGNEYKGIATMYSSSGPNHDVPVDVTVDGQQVAWQTTPGAFLWAGQQQFATP